MPEVHPAQIATHGALFTTPIPLASLEADNKTCPICHEPYIEPPASGCAHDSDQEWPVSVDMVAERLGLKRCCGHILGRRCLEKHLQACGDWRNKCPICRDIWFSNSIANNAPPSEEPHANAQREFREHSPLRRSSRIAFQSTGRRNAPGPRMSDRNGVSRPRPHPSHSVPPSRSTRFMQQLLSTLEVEHGSDQIKGTLEEVERRLEVLYGDGNVVL